MDDSISVACRQTKTFLEQNEHYIYIYIYFEEIPTTKQVKLRLCVDQKKKTI